MAHQLFKECPFCHHVLARPEFGERRNGNLSSYCKACRRIYSKAHYKLNAAKYSNHRLENVRRYRKRNRAFISAYLREHPCVDCGEVDPTVLEFDHIGKKESNVADLARTGRPVAALRAEIEKCVVRCANCHRRRTARQFAWTK
jgi:hypothetical protein